jgi:type III pantothenate kinase
MQGLITLDFGNSNPHAGLFQKIRDEWNLIKVVPLSELPIFLDQLAMSAHNTSIVLCEVRSREDEITKLQEQGFLVTRVKDYWKGSRFAGMPVHYADTLGEDRLIEAFYLYKKYKQNTLVIDAGTFVTMDVISKEGFEGGYIIPGTNAYFSVFEKGEQLKSVPLSNSFEHGLPGTTSVAMEGGYSAFAALAKKLIHERKIEKLVITGGSAPFWKSFFNETESPLVVEVDPHLIHSALQFWMTTQIEIL